MSNETAPAQPSGSQQATPPSSTSNGSDATGSTSKKSGTPVVLWVLLGCGGVAFIGVLLVLLVGFFVVKRVDEAIDVRDGQVTVRGKDGETVTFTGKDGEGTLKIEGDEGTFTFGDGTGATLPAWLPKYAGSSPKSQAVMKTDKGEHLSCTFATTDSTAQVTNFYEAKLRDAGFASEGRFQGGQGGAEHVMLTMKHDDGRQVVINAVREDQETNVVLQVLTPAP